MTLAPAEDRSVARRLLRSVERRSQVRAGLTRILLAVSLYVVIVVAAEGLPANEVATLRQVEAGKALLSVFGATGLAVYWLALRGIGAHLLPVLTVVIDAALILGNLAYNHLSTGLPGNATFLFPVVWVVPLALAANAIYLRPDLQVIATAIYLAGVPAISLTAGYVEGAERIEALIRLQASVGAAPNWVRVAMLLSTGLLLILAAYQGRRILERAVEETAARQNLTRYLPRELAPVLTEDAFSELRTGRRMPVGLLFVDIRGSTIIGSAMDPTALARFITAFRRRVGRAADRHGGVIDKFIGDGALIVFGVPHPRGDEAARALGCARTLVDLVDRWNAKRGFDPPIAVGIGVHWGEVFCGVVGEESRLEFTVLGDAVNVAARLEQATKALGGPILASADVIAAAGEDSAGWREVSREPLRHVGRAIPIMALSVVETVVVAEIRPVGA